MDPDDIIEAVGPRLRRLRTEREATLADVAATTGISVSTLSRLESGGRRASLELLLPLARAYDVPLDELVGTGRSPDPRVRPEPVTRDGTTYLPLTRRPGGLQAYKLVYPPAEPDPIGPVSLRTHEGYEWFYVLSGRVRLVLAEHDLVLGPGEAAEFDCRTPHWFGRDPAWPTEHPVELLSLFGPQGERLHVRGPGAVPSP